MLKTLPKLPLPIGLDRLAPPVRHPEFTPLLSTLVFMKMRTQSMLKQSESISGEPLFTIGMTDTVLHGEAAHARVLFEQDHLFRLHDLLEPIFATKLFALSNMATFEKLEDTGVEGEAPQRVGRLLDVAIGRSVLMRWLEQATGCGELAAFRGRLTQTREGTGGRRVWHDDLDECNKRRLALVINLSPATFTGGSFELRRKGGAALQTHHYQSQGEAILFRVDSTFEHRVLPVLAGGPRRVFAGWFVSP